MAKTHRWDNVTPAQRLDAKVDVDSTTGCWVWKRKTNSGGYGSMWLAGRAVMAHRAAYIIHKGPIPAGLDIDHLCRNRACANPAHLEAVSRRVNLLRGVGPTATRAAQTHCKRGHEFTPENTYGEERGQPPVEGGAALAQGEHAARYDGRLVQRPVTRPHGGALQGVQLEVGADVATASPAAYGQRLVDGREAAVGEGQMGVPAAP